MFYSKDQIKALTGVFHGIGDLSIKKNLYDLIIFLTHTKYQLILCTSNSAALLLKDFFVRMLVSYIDFGDVIFVWN